MCSRGRRLARLGRRRALGVALCLLCAAPAAADDLPAAYLAARSKLVTDLAELAAWCDKSKLSLDRDETWEFVLRFDPDHAEGRKALKYVFRDGRWLRSKFGDVRNRSASAHSEYLQRRAATVRTFTDAAIAEAKREDCSGVARSRILGDVLAADPDHAEARTLTGYVREGGRWVTAEIHERAVRRKKLTSVAHEALGAQPKVEASGDGWVAIEAWKIYGRFTRAELERFANVAAAVPRVVGACVGASGRGPLAEHMLHLAATPEEAEAGLQGCKGISGSADFARRVGGAVSLPDKRVLVYAPDVPAGLERVARHTAALVLERRFGVLPEAAWMREGMSLYVATLLLGTPTHALVQERDAELADRILWGSMARRDADWCALARDLLGKGPAPALDEVVRKSAIAMGATDLLLSFALVAYLVEAHEDALPALLPAGTEVLTSLDAIAKSVGLDPHQLHADFREWLARRE